VEIKAKDKNCQICPLYF